MAAKFFKSALAALMAVMLLTGSAVAVPEQQADDGTFWLWEATKNFFSAVTPSFGPADGKSLRLAQSDGRSFDEVDPPKQDVKSTAHLCGQYVHFCTK